MTLASAAAVMASAYIELSGYVDSGKQKKEYVVAFLLSKGIVADIDEVTALIESEVYKLTNTEKTAESVHISFNCFSTPSTLYED